VILQNKPNFQKSQIALKPLLKMTYEKITPYADPKNEPKTNPIFELGPRSVAQIPAHAGTQRVTGHKHRFCKTNPICKNAKQTETYV
jgi:hypothetical protein